MDDFNFKVAVMGNKIVIKLQKQWDNLLRVFHCYESVRNFTTISRLALPVLYCTPCHYEHGETIILDTSCRMCINQSKAK